MTDSQKRALWFVAALIAIALILQWLSGRAMRQAEDVVTPPAGPDFNLPFEWPNGIYPAPEWMNGSTVPFESTVNVYVDNPALAGLNNQYIPIFGLVGMTGVRG